jgi:hypothetical protein
MALKRGNVSNDEMDFIRENHEIMEPEAIAAKLNRSVSFVQKHSAQAPVVDEIQSRGDAVERLHKSHFWDEIKRTLLRTEVNYFEQQWAKLIEQFSTDDIMATDEMMIKDLIILDINGLRASAEKKKALELLSGLEMNVEKERKVDPDMMDTAMLAVWNTQITSLRTALPQLSKEHIEYQQRKDQKLRDLKATRDLRYRNIVESRKNVFEMIKDLDTHKKRQREGRWTALMQAGADKIEAEWQQTLEYEDGTYNSPMLSPEGVLAEDETLSQDSSEQTDK